MGRQGNDGTQAKGKGSGSSPYAGLKTTERAQVFQWHAVDANSVVDALAAVTRRGDCLSFAMSRAGDSVTVTVLSGSDRFRFYADTADKLVDIMQQLTDLAAELSGLA